MNRNYQLPKSFDTFIILTAPKSLPMAGGDWKDFTSAIPPVIGGIDGGNKNK